MNTIEFEGSFIRTRNFIEGGEKLFESNAYNNVISKYFIYLKSLNQAHNTLRHKITKVFCVYISILTPRELSPSFVSSF